MSEPVSSPTSARPDETDRSMTEAAASDTSTWLWPNWTEAGDDDVAMVVRSFMSAPFMSGEGPPSRFNEYLDAALAGVYAERRRSNESVSQVPCPRCGERMTL